LACSLHNRGHLRLSAERELGNLLPNNRRQRRTCYALCHILRIVPHTVPRVGRSYEHFPDGFELHLLPGSVQRGAGGQKPVYHRGVRVPIRQFEGKMHSGQRWHEHTAI